MLFIPDLEHLLACMLETPADAWAIAELRRAYVRALGVGNGHLFSRMTHAAATSSDVMLRDVFAMIQHQLLEAPDLPFALKLQNVELMLLRPGRYTQEARAELAMLKSMSSYGCLGRHELLASVKSSARFAKVKTAGGVRVRYAEAISAGTIAVKEYLVNLEKEDQDETMRCQQDIVISAATDTDDYNHNVFAIAALYQSGEMCEDDMLESLDNAVQKFRDDNDEISEPCGCSKMLISFLSGLENGSEDPHDDLMRALDRILAELGNYVDESEDMNEEFDIEALEVLETKIEEKVQR